MGKNNLFGMWYLENFKYKTEHQKGKRIFQKTAFKWGSISSDCYGLTASLILSELFGPAQNLHLFFCFADVRNNSSFLFFYNLTTDAWSLGQGNWQICTKTFVSNELARAHKFMLLFPLSRVKAKTQVCSPGNLSDWSVTSGPILGQAAWTSSFIQSLHQ